MCDLGAGDGKIAIAAAKKFGARAIGIEYNPDMVKHANANAQNAGVAGNGPGKAIIRHGDIFATDFSQATVVTLYLLPALNMKLRPQLLSMRPGTRVVSHSFSMEDWEADEISHARRPPRLLLDGAGQRDGRLEPRRRRRRSVELSLEQTLPEDRAAPSTLGADARRAARGAPARHQYQLRLRRPAAACAATSPAASPAARWKAASATRRAREGKLERDQEIASFLCEPSQNGWSRAALAAAQPDLLRLGRCVNFTGVNSVRLVRAVAERLALRLAAGAPPVVARAPAPPRTGAVCAISGSAMRLQTSAPGSW